MMGRREVIGGMAGLLLAPRALAAVAPTDQLFAGTALAGNRVARAFARVDLPLPDVAVLTRAGRARLAAPAPGPRLLTLWAEWCVPCLVEARDLAALRPQVADGRFDIVSVLTGSIGKLDWAGAAKRLEQAGAAGLTVMVEPDGAHAVADALSARPPAAPPPPDLPPGATIVRRGPGYSLPCTLLVDRAGRVRGRALGIASATPPLPGAVRTPHVLTEAEKQALMGPATKTAWSTPDGLALLRAVRDGALDRA